MEASMAAGRRKHGDPPAVAPTPERSRCHAQHPACLAQPDPFTGVGKSGKIAPKVSVSASVAERRQSCPRCHTDVAPRLLLPDVLCQELGIILTMRASRLVSLLLLLQTRGRMTASELA